MSLFGNVEDLNRRLAEFLASKKVSAMPSTSNVAPVIGPANYQGDVPETLYHLAGSEGEDERRKRLISEYLSKPIEVTIPKEYSDLSIVNGDMRPGSLDFPDDSLRDQVAIQLPRCSDNDICVLGRVVIPMVVSGFSRQGAAAIFLIAYHLKKPESNYGEDYVFGDIDDLELPADKMYTEFSTRVMSICGTSDPIPPGRKPAKEAAVYSFVATAMLRLFTKSPRNFILAWNHIIDGFSRFYGDTVDIILPTPVETAMKSLSVWFSIEPKAKATLYRLLYLGNNSQDHSDLKRFLYDIHLSNTGMDIINIMVQLCKVTGATPGLILTIINNGETENQVKCLVAALRLMQDTTPERSKRMWRYGRIFDETFLSEIRTKACPKLVYILAAAFKMEASKSHNRILNIEAQLGDVSKDNKEKCEIAAKKLLMTIKEFQSQGRDR